jgi:hypothetical protein
MKTRTKTQARLYIFLLASCGWGAELWAQAIPAPAPSPQVEASPDPSKKGRRIGRQAEGSQAPNKFEADPVVQSKYQLNGRPLEVDPD